MSEQQVQSKDSQTESHLTAEEKLVQILLMIAFPVLIGFVTWGVMLLAYYQWLVY